MEVENMSDEPKQSETAGPINRQELVFFICLSIYALILTGIVAYHLFIAPVSLFALFVAVSPLAAFHIAFNQMPPRNGR